ncbi:peroxisomal targeting signal 2 receptor [[Candida] railenensis]|uniref:Peroxin-7 n=1 Tax=[Candida] railenensis TaxID=45579 RepID=A0A9P0QR62_9ASCO|nr:peroxisomal targeting signal 2 receptor [[Candida] railenensis]
MLSFRTTGYNGYGVTYSPFFDNKIAVATAANYGLVGNGKLYILNIEPNGTISNQISWESQDGLFDVSWSEAHENQCVVASGDGSVKLFDLKVGQFPVMNWKEHQREVFSVNWNLVDKSNFVTTSWDGTIKIWTPNRQESMLTLNPGEVDFTTKTSPVINTAKPPAPPMSHNQKNQPFNTANCIYNATFSPHSPSTLISCNGSSHLQIWDIRAPHPLQIDFVAHGGLEALSCDWNKYKSTIVASGGTDKSVRIWDLRMVSKLDQPMSNAPMPAYHMRGPTPLNQMLGHDFAIRKVLWSPHDSQELMSTSYDMTCRVWQDKSNERARFLNVGDGACKGVMRAHKEFTVGCDYSLWGEPGWAVSTGWDEMVYVWDSKRL